jgi:hypothetical protein
MRRSASITVWAFIGSSEAMGSSARMIFGSCISARAMATRCCCPPDSASARFWAWPAMPSRSRICDGAADVLLGPEREQRGERAPAVERPVQHVRHHIEPWHEVELLEDHRALRLPAAVRRALQRGDVRALEQHAAPRGIGQAVDHAQEGGLARPRPADHSDHHGTVHGQRHAVHGAVGAELRDRSSMTSIPPLSVPGGA